MTSWQASRLLQKRIYFFPLNFFTCMPCQKSYFQPVKAATVLARYSHYVIRQSEKYLSSPDFAWHIVSQPPHPSLGPQLSLMYTWRASLFEDSWRMYSARPPLAKVKLAARQHSWNIRAAKMMQVPDTLLQTCALHLLPILPDDALRNHHALWHGFRSFFCTVDPDCDRIIAL